MKSATEYTKLKGRNRPSPLQGKFATEPKKKRAGIFIPKDLISPAKKPHNRNQEFNSVELQGAEPVKKFMPTRIEMNLEINELEKSERRNIN
jgi:hypothetical protein